MNRTLLAQEIRATINKWDFMKLATSVLKRLLRNGEKNFSKYTLDRGLASRIYKELKDGTPRKQPNLLMGSGTEWSSQKNTKG